MFFSDFHFFFQLHFQFVVLCVCPCFSCAYWSSNAMLTTPVSSMPLDMLDFRCICRIWIYGGSQMTRISALNHCFGPKSFATHRVAAVYCPRWLRWFWGARWSAAACAFDVWPFTSARKQFQNLLGKINKNPCFVVVPARFLKTKKTV